MKYLYYLLTILELFDIWQQIDHVRSVYAGTHALNFSHNTLKEDLRNLHESEKSGSKRLKRQDSSVNQHSMCSTASGIFTSPENCATGGKFQCNYFLTWSYLKKSDSIEFTFKYPSNDGSIWYAVGFSYDGNMPNTDIILVRFDLSTMSPDVRDMWAETRALPKEDKKDYGEEIDIYDITSNYNRITTNITFKRSRWTVNPHDVHFADDKCYFFFFGRGPYSIKNERVGKHLFPPVITETKLCIHPCAGKSRATFSTAVELVSAIFSTQLTNEKSEFYKSFKIRIDDSLSQAYYSLAFDFISKIDIEIIGFHGGSIIVSYIVTAAYDNKGQSNLTNEVVSDMLLHEFKEYLNKSKHHLPNLEYYVIFSELIPEVGKDIVEKSSRTVTIFLYFGTIVILICIVQAIKLFTETKNEALISKSRLEQGEYNEYSNLNEPQGSHAVTDESPTSALVQHYKSRMRLQKKVVAFSKTSWFMQQKAKSKAPEDVEAETSLSAFSFEDLSEEEKEEKQRRAEKLPDKKKPEVSLLASTLTGFSDFDEKTSVKDVAAFESAPSEKLQAIPDDLFKKDYSEQRKRIKQKYGEETMNRGIPKTLKKNRGSFKSKKESEKIADQKSFKKVDIAQCSKMTSIKDRFSNHEVLELIPSADSLTNDIKKDLPILANPKIMTTYNQKKINYDSKRIAGATTGSPTRQKKRSNIDAVADAAFGLSKSGTKPREMGYSPEVVVKKSSGTKIEVQKLKTQQK